MRTKEEKLKVEDREKELQEMDEIVRGNQIVADLIEQAELKGIQEEKERILKIISRFAKESDVDGREIMFDFTDTDLNYLKKEIEK